MTTQTIPTRQDVARYDLKVELDDETFTLDFDWNDRDAGWYISVSDVNGEPLVSGRRITLNYPIAFRYVDARLPAGVLMAIDTGPNEEEPGFADLGQRVKLVYIPAADL